MAAVFIISYVFIGCATANTANSVQKPAPQTQNLFTAFPEGNSLIFIGVSGPQRRHEQEIETAREDAARKASLYHGLAASFALVHGSGANALDYFSDTSFRMEYDTQLEHYKEKLTYDPERNVVNSNGSIFISFSYPGTFPGNINYSSEKEPDGSPRWIKHPPQEINGFTAQVGFARRHQRIRDTIIKASEHAIAGHISSVSSLISTADSAYNQTGATFVTQQSHGRLMHFMILEIWIDPKNLSAWILTIAKSVN